MVRKKKTGSRGDGSLSGVKINKRVTKSGSTGKKTKRKDNLHISKKNDVSESIKSPEKTNKDRNETVLKLDNILGISDIHELHKTLHGILNKESDILIDASDVQSVDTAVLQLLTAFCLKLDRNGYNIKWKNPTQTFIDRCCLLNLEELLKLN